jgi:hypothetical protein
VAALKMHRQKILHWVGCVYFNNFGP